MKIRNKQKTLIVPSKPSCLVIYNRFEFQLVIKFRKMVLNVSHFKEDRNKKLKLLEIVKFILMLHLKKFKMLANKSAFFPLGVRYFTQVYE